MDWLEERLIKREVAHYLHEMTNLLKEITRDKRLTEDEKRNIIEYGYNARTMSGWINRIEWAYHEMLEYKARP